MSEESLIPKVQAVSYYASEVKRRNIFQPYEEKTTTGVVTTGISKDSPIVRKTKNLRLVGISWLDTVESASAMIEDTEKNMTYFLKKGEKMGDIIVKTIYADSVALGYENEEIIIKYDKSKM